MTPTREQLIERAKEVGLSFDDGWLFYTPKRPSLQEPEIDAFIAAMNLAHTAGREQGLREAKEACEALPASEWEQPDGSRASAEPTAQDCAAAIEQLRGK